MTRNSDNDFDVFDFGDISSDREASNENTGKQSDTELSVDEWDESFGRLEKQYDKERAELRRKEILRRRKEEKWDRIHRNPMFAFVLFVLFMTLGGLIDISGFFLDELFGHESVIMALLEMVLMIAGMVIAFLGMPIYYRMRKKRKQKKENEKGK